MWQRNGKKFSELTLRDFESIRLGTRRISVVKELSSIADNGSCLIVLDIGGKAHFLCRWDVNKPPDTMDVKILENLPHDRELGFFPSGSENIEDVISNYLKDIRSTLAGKSDVETIDNLSKRLVCLIKVGYESKSFFAGIKDMDGFINAADVEGGGIPIWFIDNPEGWDMMNKVLEKIAKISEDARKDIAEIAAVYSNSWYRMRTPDGYRMATLFAGASHRLMPGIFQYSHLYVWALYHSGEKQVAVNALQELLSEEIYQLDKQQRKILITDLAYASLNDIVLEANSLENEISHGIKTSTFIAREGRLEAECEDSLYFLNMVKDHYSRALSGIGKAYGILAQLNAMKLKYFNKKNGKQCDMKRESLACISNIATAMTFLRNGYQSAKEIKSDGALNAVSHATDMLTDRHGYLRCYMLKSIETLEKTDYISAEEMRLAKYHIAKIAAIIKLNQVIHEEDQKEWAKLFDRLNAYFKFINTIDIVLTDAMLDLSEDDLRKGTDLIMKGIIENAADRIKKDNELGLVSLNHERIAEIIKCRLQSAGFDRNSGVFCFLYGKMFDSMPASLEDYSVYFQSISEEPWNEEAVLKSLSAIEKITGKDIVKRDIGDNGENNRGDQDSENSMSSGREKGKATAKNAVFANMSPSDMKASIDSEQPHLLRSRIFKLWEQYQILETWEGHSKVHPGYVLMCCDKIKKLLAKYESYEKSVRAYLDKYNGMEKAERKNAESNLTREHSVISSILKELKPKIDKREEFIRQIISEELRNYNIKLSHFRGKFGLLNISLVDDLCSIMENALSRFKEDSKSSCGVRTKEAFYEFELKVQGVANEIEQRLAVIGTYEDVFRNIFDMKSEIKTSCKFYLVRSEKVEGLIRKLDILKDVVIDHITEGEILDDIPERELLLSLGKRITHARSIRFKIDGAFGAAKEEVAVRFVPDIRDSFGESMVKVRILMGNDIMAGGGGQPGMLRCLFDIGEKEIPEPAVMDKIINMAGLKAYKLMYVTMCMSDKFWTNIERRLNKLSRKLPVTIQKEIDEILEVKKKVGMLHDEIIGISPYGEGAEEGIFERISADLEKTVDDSNACIDRIESVRNKYIAEQLELLMKMTVIWLKEWVNDKDEAKEVGRMWEENLSILRNSSSDGVYKNYKKITDFEEYINEHTTAIIDDVSRYYCEQYKRMLPFFIKLYIKLNRYPAIARGLANKKTGYRFQPAIVYDAGSGGFVLNIFFMIKDEKVDEICHVVFPDKTHINYEDVRRQGYLNSDAKEVITKYENASKNQVGKAKDIRLDMEMFFELIKELNRIYYIMAAERIGEPNYDFDDFPLDLYSLAEYYYKKKASFYQESNNTFAPDYILENEAIAARQIRKIELAGRAELPQTKGWYDLLRISKRIEHFGFSDNEQSRRFYRNLAAFMEYVRPGCKHDVNEKMFDSETSENSDKAFILTHGEKMLKKGEGRDNGISAQAVVKLSIDSRKGARAFPEELTDARSVELAMRINEALSFYLSIIKDDVNASPENKRNAISIIDGILNRIKGKGDIEIALKKDLINRNTMIDGGRILFDEGLFSALSVFHKNGWHDTVNVIIAERILHELGLLAYADQYTGSSVARLVKKEEDQLMRDIVLYKDLFGSNRDLAARMDDFTDILSENISGSEKDKFSRIYMTTRLFGNISQWAKRVDQEEENVKKEVSEYVKDTIRRFLSYETPIFDSPAESKGIVSLGLVRAMAAVRLFHIQDERVVNNALASGAMAKNTTRKTIMISEALIPVEQRKGGLIKKFNERSEIVNKLGLTNEVIKIAPFSMIRNLKDADIRDCVIMLTENEKKRYAGPYISLGFRNSGMSPVILNGIIAAGRAIVYKDSRELYDILSGLDKNGGKGLPSIDIIEECLSSRMQDLSNIIPLIELPLIGIASEDMENLNTLMLELAIYA